MNPSNTRGLMGRVPSMWAAARASMSTSTGPSSTPTLQEVGGKVASAASAVKDATVQKLAAARDYLQDAGASVREAAGSMAPGDAKSPPPVDPLPHRHETGKSHVEHVGDMISDIKHGVKFKQAYDAGPVGGGVGLADLGDIDARKSSNSRNADSVAAAASAQSEKKP